MRRTARLARRSQRNQFRLFVTEPAAAAEKAVSDRTDGAVGRLRVHPVRLTRALPLPSKQPVTERPRLLSLNLLRDKLP